MVSAKVQPIRPGGLPELVMSAYSGGAHCCTTSLMYTQDTGRLENFGVKFYGLNGRRHPRTDRVFRRFVLLEHWS